MERDLDETSRHLGRAMGRIMLMLVRRRATRSSVEEIISWLEQAIASLRRIT